jgi:hypothetical protein
MNLFRTITVVLLVTWTSAHAAAKRLDSTGETWNRTAADAGYDMDQAPVRRYVGVLITGQSTQGDENADPIEDTGAGASHEDLFSGISCPKGGNPNGGSCQ